MTIGVVVGMLSEARLLDGLGCEVVAGGGYEVSTRCKIEELVDKGVTALASFGIAGALDPLLKPGELIIADRVVMPDGRLLSCDANWLERSQQKVTAKIGTIAGTSIAAATQVEKRILFEKTGAIAVDMESHHVAEAAQLYGLPFLVMRAIADTAQESIPEAALRGLDKEGRAAIGAVLLSLLKNPCQLPGLIRLALRTKIAMQTLFSSRTGLL